MTGPSLWPSKGNKGKDMVKEAGSTTQYVRIQIELFGLARIKSGIRVVEVDVPSVTNVGEVAKVLSENCPVLLGLAILDDKTGLQPSYTFNLNGTEFLGDGEEIRLEQGDSLLLFSSQAGG